MVAAQPALVRPPRFVVRVLAASFATVVVVLTAIVAVILLHTRQVVERSVVETVEAGQRLIATVEAERQRDAAVQAAVLAESPALREALERYGSAHAATHDAGLRAIHSELARFGGLVPADVIALADNRRVVAAVGTHAAGWDGRALAIGPDTPGTFETIVTFGDQPFAVTATPVVAEGVPPTHLVVGTRLDQAYAVRLATLSRTGVAVTLGERVVATTLADGRRATFEAAAQAGLADAGAITLGGERFAYRRIRRVGPAAFYAVESVTLASARVLQGALPKLIAIACGGLVLCLIASARLARSVSAPIDRLSRELAEMADAHETGPLLTPEASSREMATLVETFNRLVGSLSSARAETDAAVVGAIRALAAALDARDAYTAGHSERVSSLSVAIGRQMHVSEGDVEVLRLGALLHDIGKIGISDNILGKPTALTEEEYEIIKIHPVLGAQILRTVPFLEPHLPIVELHHEQPDGLGYPYGLRGDQIPLLARIVHVADAFDAMTTARAYRAGRPAPEALAVLWRHAGSQFDLDAVRGLSAALPEFLGSLPAPREERRATAAEVVPFERRVAEG